MMTLNNLIRALLISSLALCCCSSLTPASAPANSPSVVGTWTGDSICVGDHPACKNEVVVYRFEPVAGKPQLVSLFGDKIIDGKRVPMGKLDCQYDETKGAVSCEFTVGRTHGIWRYQMSGDKIEGTLSLLPGESVGRRVQVKRVSEDKVPAAPPRDAYGVLERTRSPFELRAG